MRLIVSCLHDMNRLADFNQICMDITLGHNEELLRCFGDLDLIVNDMIT